MSKEQFSFSRGWAQVRNGDIPMCREKLMAALNVTTRAAFLVRMKGKVEPKVSEAKAVEEVFSEFGITDVWGIAE